MIKITGYSADRRAEWNDFVSASKNGSFLFDRDYMEYHADRFCDYSLMFFNRDKLCAVLPADVKDDCCHSHGGLTYGGVISGSDMKTATMLSLFDALIVRLRDAGIKKLIYKPVPHIYHRMPAEEDLYALFRKDASLCSRQVSTAVCPQNRPGYSKGRKACVSKARRFSLAIREAHTAEDINGFWQILTGELQARRQAAPVHTANEMSLLKSRFPKNIRLFGAYAGDDMLSGVLIYENETTAHCQYIAAGERGRECCAPDFLMDKLLTETFVEKRWFDWGTSNHDGGRVLDEQLILNKESFGGRAVCYDAYEIKL